MHAENFFAMSRDGWELPFTGAGLADNCAEHFSKCEGEFCFFFFDPIESRILFGRDVFGRKSLCWRIGRKAKESESEAKIATFELSMFPGLCGEEAEWHEVPPGTLFDIPLKNPTAVRTEVNRKVGTKFPDHPILDFCAEFESNGGGGGEEAEEFVGQPIRVHSFYPLAHFQTNPIFQTFRSVLFEPIQSDILLQPAQQPQTPVAVDGSMLATFTSEFDRRFFAATENILQKVVAPNGFGALEEVSVLFSGGVDSLGVALALGDLLLMQTGTEFRGKVRLFTVAFGEKEEAFWDYSAASDRAQSIAAFEQLGRRSLQKYGRNPFSLVLVNVSREELAECRRKFIAEAISPLRTVLDDSLGCVLWFASRMAGSEYSAEGRGEKVEAQTQFVLVGSGSDEQLGGYARHRSCFEAKGLDGLAAELSMEMHRIGQRNFGRDDRVGTSNGRAILAPFLEEPLVRWLNKVPTAIKTGFSLAAAADQNKFLLRNALRTLGMPEMVVGCPKRAMQFGTGIAKLDRQPGEKGSHICQRLQLLGGGGQGQ